jgi:arginine deiminase
VLWVKRAKQEHDAFADTLRDLGVQVHLFHELLRETVALPEAKAYLLDRVFDERGLRADGRRRAAQRL